MATYNYTNSGIDFILEDNDVLQFDKLSNASGSIKRGNIVPLINAVEIDWNGAEITSTAFPSMDRTINTTGDLLSWIKEGIEEAAVSGRISEVVRRSLWIN